MKPIIHQGRAGDKAIFCCLTFVNAMKYGHALVSRVTVFTLYVRYLTTESLALAVKIHCVDYFVWSTRIQGDTKVESAREELTICPNQNGIGQKVRQS